MNYQQAFYTLKERLRELYDEGESVAVAHEVLESVTGLGRMERLMQKATLLTATQEALWLKMTQELSHGRPLQYVLGHAWFMGRSFVVNEQVLIPRPETEELVQWIVADCKALHHPFRVLDIGTGSGCIPISLQLALPQAVISSADISSGALEVAAENARKLQAHVQLLQVDFLDRQTWPELPVPDVLVSNPPYIPLSEKSDMHANVRDYEPGTALFVPDQDPLLFYRALATFGKERMATGSCVYCELHRDYAIATKELFDAEHYTTELRQDLHGNLRMLKARRP